MKLKLKEFSIQAPWGEIALVSCGDPNGPPVLVVHGRADSSASFLPLLEISPQHYHYVAVDLPGHGHSDPFPVGVMLTRLHFVLPVMAVVKHLGWEQFIYIGHSMGAQIGLFYNVIEPHRVKKLVLIDPPPALRDCVQDPPEVFYKNVYQKYYENYDKMCRDDRVYTRRRIVEAVMRARTLSQTQAELVLSRNLTPIGPDQYKISWDRRLNSPSPAGLNLSLDYYLQLFTQAAPPTLIVIADKDMETRYGAKIPAVLNLLSSLQATLTEFHVVTVREGHDVHLTHPHLIASHLRDFMEKDLGFCKAKL